MGVLNPPARSTTFKQEVRDPEALIGNVALISQSGSVAASLLADLRRFGFSLVVSSGNEAVNDTASYIEFAIDDPNTKVIATFTESVRNPDRYIAALDRAADKGKPVIVLKVGRSERVRAAITGHTGGLAGELRVFSEILKAHRAIEVEDLDEFTEVLAVCQGTRWPTGNGINVVTTSGGQAELILDVATSAGIPLRPLPAATREAVERDVGRVTGDGNPLDAWGRGDFRTTTPEALRLLSENPATDAIVFCSSDSVDNQALGRAGREEDYAKLFAAGRRQEHASRTTSCRCGRASCTRPDPHPGGGRRRGHRRHAAGTRRDRAAGALEHAAGAGARCRRPRPPPNWPPTAAPSTNSTPRRSLPATACR